MAAFSVREATQQDSASIVLLINQLAAADAEKYPIDSNYVEFYLRQPGCNVLVAEEAGSIVGLLSFSIRPNLYHASPVCLVEELIVSEPSRRHGIGGELLEAAITRARLSGCAEISVTTMPDNTGAMDFYRRHGLTDEAVYLEMHFLA
jgi:ribosomal protein S18 acetylase RimI-like enzyme